MGRVIKIISENKKFDSVKAAVCELAFSRYPVIVETERGRGEFDDFDSAKAFAEGAGDAAEPKTGSREF